MTKIPISTTSIGKNKISVVGLGLISDVKTGLDTGNNQHYVFKVKNFKGQYADVDSSKILKINELKKIQINKKLREQVVEYGIQPNLFNGRTLVPFDKGGGSDMEQKRLSNYCTTTNFFVDWSTLSLKRMKTLTIAQRMRNDGIKKIPKSYYETTLASTFRNLGYQFKHGITFPKVGIPTFRLNAGGIFNTGGNCLFVKKEFEGYFSTEYLLGILCTKLNVYIIKNFINNTVNTQVDDMKKIPIPITDKHTKEKIESLVESIITQLNKDPDYSYDENEQIEIDEIVYQIYGLDSNLTQEIKDWFIRKYPHLRKG